VRPWPGTALRLLRVQGHPRSPDRQADRRDVPGRGSHPREILRTRWLAMANVAHCIGTFCNRTRRHSHLGGITSEEFEAAHISERRGVHGTQGTPSATGCPAARSRQTTVHGTQPSASHPALPGMLASAFPSSLDPLFCRMNFKCEATGSVAGQAQG
jgi:hypothetical protein